MSLLSWLGWRAVPASVAPASIAAWDAAPNSLVPVVLSDIFGETVDLPITRAEAMTVPAVAAAQTTLVSAFGNLGLQAVKNGAVMGVQPRWMSNTDRGEQPAYLRLSRTIADFMYIGFSLWQCRRGADAFPAAAWHVPFGKWHFDDAGRILIDEKPVDGSEVIFFESMQPGILNTGTRTLRAAIEIERTIEERAKVSVPTTLLKRTDDVDMDPDEVKDLLAQYKTLRRSRDGSAVGFVPAGLELTVLTEPTENWLLEARNAVVSDVSRLTGVPSTQLGGTSSIDSLTYTTELGQLNNLLTQTAHLYLDPIEARLSMSDVTPNGQTVQFDLTPLDAMLQPAEPLTAREGRNGVTQEA